MLTANPAVPLWRRSVRHRLAGWPGSRLHRRTTAKWQEPPSLAVTTGVERTNVQDVGFGFRQLVDVAARALSPGINDPTTAVHVLGHLSALLCRLTQRHPGPIQLTDDEGVRTGRPGHAFAGDLLELVMAQPRLYGMADPAVAERLFWNCSRISHGPTATAGTGQRYSNRWQGCAMR